MDNLLKNALETLYLPKFLNNSGIYYTSGRNHCYCRRVKCRCNTEQIQEQEKKPPSGAPRTTTQSGFVRMNFPEENVPRNPYLEIYRHHSSGNFTDQRKLYEDSHTRRSKRSKSGTLHSAEEEFVTLESDLDLDQLYELCEFRERNSMECMSVNNLQRYRKKNQSKFTSGHKCIHKFSINDQLNPKPRLANGQGESLCAVCGGVSQFLKDHTVNEIISRDPHLGGKDKPIIVLEVMTNAGRREKMWNSS